MSDRSIELAKQSLSGRSKYDYFIVGIAAATFAYFAKDFEFDKFGNNEESFVLIALLLLIISIISGLKKIDVSNFFVEKNGKHLDFQEYLASYKQCALECKPFINMETGETCTPEEAKVKASRLQVTLDKWDKVLKFTETKLQIYYVIRDYSLVASYILLGLSKFYPTL
ncbi:hypothetical protein NQT69_00730 [Pseudoalteromonas shioyasakiensis]|uniref:hypothetical protein n=1 Tax=Pseudoalteromonas shioyasakiensis TaxID=1190813 RepID=UPI00211800A7|nr:hypothetical protein [Pseudoalteromonas shioyasakiensis]MCQ8876565.1 hypothetical protein [Pseudoalteromonas shioyasakiensis]